MNLNDCFTIKPHSEDGVEGELWKATFNYQGLKLCGVGYNRTSLLVSMARKVRELSEEMTRMAEEMSNATP